MNSSIPRLLLSLLAMVWFCGCTLFQKPLPRTAALKEVHDRYRAEFADLLLPGPANSGFPKGGTNAPFAQTLRGIRAYRVTFSNAAPAELAHLTVLEGMIYLQSGRIGMARMVSNQVAAAAGQLLSAGGSPARDGLFAENFGSLLVGWNEIAENSDNLPSTSAEPDKLRSAAATITTNLNRRLTAGTLLSAEADEGAVYLATTAAIFDAWSYELLRDPTKPEEARALRRELFPPVRDLMGKFLNPAELAAASSAGGGESPPSSRLRYVQWYHWLGEQADQ